MTHVNRDYIIVFPDSNTAVTHDSPARPETGMNLTKKVMELEWKMKATEQYFPVVLFIMLYKAVLTFESVYEILKCDHLNESYWAKLSCGAAYHAVPDGSNIWVFQWNPRV